MYRVILFVDHEVIATDLIRKDDSVTDWARTNLESYPDYDPGRSEASVEVSMVAFSLNIR